jgi:hypothetical protein
VFIYNSISGSSVLYIIDNDVAISTSGELLLETNIFTESGILSIGQWVIPLQVHQYNMGKGFEGDIENFMIWNTLVDASQVSQLHQMNSAVATASLIYALQFNKGEGMSTIDSVNNSKIILPEYPYKAPEWQISDILYVDSDLLHQPYAYFKNSRATLENVATSLCGQGLFSSTSCSGTNNATLEFFYLKCTQAISATGDTTSSYTAIVDVYKICLSQSAAAIETYCI